MLFKKLIILIFTITFGGSMVFLIFWDLPAPSKQIERKIDINRLKTHD